MKQKKGKMHIILPVLVVAVILVFYFFNFHIGSYLHPDETAYSMEELTQLVTEQINDGKTTGNFYVSGISESDIGNINENLCSMNGMVDQYMVTEKSRDGMRIQFRYEISDNYYVWQKYVNGAAIPSDHALAYKLYDKVEDVLKQIIKPDMTDYEKELAIHDYIVVHCQYGYVESSKDYAYRAYGALVQNKAVCNGYAEAMALLMTCVGIENQIVTGTADNELHAWNQVCLDGDWYQVDATWDDPLPDRGVFAGHEYFNVTDEIMDERHDWKQDAFPACDSTDYNYYEQNDLICDSDAFRTLLKDQALRNSTGTIEVVVTDYTTDFDYSFMQDVSAVQYFQYTEEPYGAYELVTVYLNQR
jgi:transglutaminase-like putative cysteine protease